LKIELKIVNKDYYNQYSVPSYATPGASAIDLVCTENIDIAALETRIIKTGISIHIGSHDDKALRAYRQHWAIMGVIAPRSGLGSKGLILANTIGVIDEDYQGELLVNAWNRGGDLIQLKAGDRFAQLMFVPVIRAQFSVVKEFSHKTLRGDGSFGSTDK